MGIILRQTIKSTVYSYLGVGVGFVTIVILMTKYFSLEEIGVRVQILNYSITISSFLAFGIPQSIIRMFPYFYNQENKNHGILSLIGIPTLISCFIVIVGFYFLSDLFLHTDYENSPLFEKHSLLIVPATIASLIYMIVDSYATAVKETTIGVFTKDLALRLFILANLTGFILFEFINYDFFIVAFAYLQFIPPLLIILFLSRKGLFPIISKISFPSADIRSELISVSLYGWVNVLSGIAIITVDTIMLSKYYNSAIIGVYSIVFYIASFMLIPLRSLGKITNTIIAEHFKKQNFEEIKSIYKKSALNPFIIGLFLFINLILAVPFIFNILLNGKFNDGIWVLAFLGFSNVIRMTTGFKFTVISNSKYYRWTTLFLILFILLLILTNWTLIPKFGMRGAAIASLIASSLYHLSGMIFVKYKFGFWATNMSFVKIGVVPISLGLALFFIPNFDYPNVVSILKSGIFSILFITYIIQTNSSPQFSEIFSTAVNKFKKNYS